MKQFKMRIEGVGELCFLLCATIAMAIVTYASFFDLREIYGFMGGLIWGIFIFLVWFVLGSSIYSLIKDVKIYWVEIK